jgi:hypothetical protein
MWSQSIHPLDFRPSGRRIIKSSDHANDDDESPSNDRHPPSVCSTVQSPILSSRHFSYVYLRSLDLFEFPMHFRMLLPPVNASRWYWTLSLRFTSTSAPDIRTRISIRDSTALVQFRLEYPRCPPSFHPSIHPSIHLNDLNSHRPSSIDSSCSTLNVRRPQFTSGTHHASLDPLTRNEGRDVFAVSYTSVSPVSQRSLYSFCIARYAGSINSRLGLRVPNSDTRRCAGDVPIHSTIIRMSLR